VTRTRSPRPEACTSCEVPLRDKAGPTIAGTRVHMGRGLCSACWKRETYGYRPLPERPPACTSCGRGWDVVPYTARGLCSGCYSTQRYRETTERVRTSMPETCAACTRPLRRKTDPKEPGTVRFAGKGLCGSCTNAAKHGRTRGVTRPHRPMPEACAACSRRLRRPGTKVPGTVVFAADGMCGTCYNAARRGETVTIRVTPSRTPTECTRCERPMRTKTKAAPGFVVHRARGLCATCYVVEARRERELLAYVLGGAA